jgi:hypothetical protein
MNAMRIAILLAALLLPTAAVVPLAAAEDLPPIGQTSYEARFVMTGGQETISGTVHHTPDAERREMELQGMRQTMLLRADKGEVLMLFPKMNSAMRMPMNRDPNVDAQAAFARMNPEAVGTETVNGEETTVYAVDAEIEGRFWVTEDGIVMRTDMTTAEGPVFLELSQVARGPQDPALFEVPEGMEVHEAGSMPMAPQQ